WDPDVRELRAECYIRMGDPQKAIQDLAPTARLRNDNRAAFLKLSMLHYALGEHHESLSNIRECLKLDQDDKECFSHYKQVKKLSKQLDSAEELIQSESYQEAIDKYEAVMKTEPNVPYYTNLAKERVCFSLVKMKSTHDAIDACSEAHQRDPRNANILRDRAEAYILNQEYEKAVEDYKEALDFDDKQEIKEGLERAQKLLKISQKRDYYKILGVSRSANKQEIIKAYRKVAQQWHPDNFQSEAEKKEAEKKFIDIASAKEVLTDPGEGPSPPPLVAFIWCRGAPASLLCRSRNETEVRRRRGSAGPGEPAGGRRTGATLGVPLRPLPVGRQLPFQVPVQLSGGGAEAGSLCPASLVRAPTRTWSS
ncbi:unnamed protein product, partial [Tetraodon nigroviridis]